MSDQKRCPTCGEEYPLSERFCPRDGTALRLSSPTGELEGTTVAGRYQVLRTLGEGGMGRVYLAEHIKMGRKVALKVMTPALADAGDAVARFNREAANASRLNHPNVCAVYDFGETSDGMMYLAMEFVDGRALTDIIDEGGAMAPARVASIIEQTAAALGAAHDAGIVHRDLKPDNIMIARVRDADVVKVVDFGIAKTRESGTRKLTRTGHVMGTPDYMSPEQLSGGELDPRSDIYSLGIVAFNCLTGVLPFQSQDTHEAMMMRLTRRPVPLREANPRLVGSELQAVMDQVLARDPKERYQVAMEFSRDFVRAALTSGVDDGATQPLAERVATDPQRGATGPGTLQRGATGEGRSGDARGSDGVRVAVLVGAVLVAAAGGAWAVIANRGAAAAAPASQKPDSVRGPGAAKDGVVPVSRTAVAPPSGGRRDSVSVPAQSPAPAADHRAELDSLEVLLDGESVTKAEAAVVKVNALLPLLTGVEKGEALWRLGEARFTLKDRTRACQALEEARGILRGTKLAASVDAYFDRDQIGTCLSPLTSGYLSFPAPSASAA